PFIASAYSPHHTNILRTRRPRLFLFFFFNDTPPPEIYTLSLHDALPIWCGSTKIAGFHRWPFARTRLAAGCGTRTTADFARPSRDRKSTRLNSSHVAISYAVFCLKKKKRIRCSDRDFGWVHWHCGGFAGP